MIKSLVSLIARGVRCTNQRTYRGVPIFWASEKTKISSPSCHHLKKALLAVKLFLRWLDSQLNVQESEDFAWNFWGWYFKLLFLSKSFMYGLGTKCTYFFTWQLLSWPQLPHLNSLSDRKNRSRNYLKDGQRKKLSWWCMVGGTDKRKLVPFNDVTCFKLFNYSFEL